MLLLHGDSAARLVSKRVAESVADLTALRGIPTKRAVHGMTCLVQADYSMWQFHSSSVLTDDGLLVIEPADLGAGAWLRMCGGIELRMPIAAATADGAILLTVPTGALLSVREFFWQVSVDFAGGASSAIGASSSNKNDSADFTTKGDFLGGASGDIAATLVASSGVFLRGTIGTDWDTIAKRRTLFKPTETVRFDRITSAFTTGSGFVIAVADLLRNAGA